MVGKHYWLEGYSLGIFRIPRVSWIPVVYRGIKDSLNTV